MNKRSGLYPCVQADAAAVGVVSQAGGVALLETVRVCGLDRTLRQALGLWRKPTAVHDPAKVLLDLAVSLALGGGATRTAACTAGTSPSSEARAPTATPSRSTPASAAGWASSSTRSPCFAPPPR